MDEVTRAAVATQAMATRVWAGLSGHVVNHREAGRLKAPAQEHTDGVVLPKGKPNFFPFFSCGRAARRVAQSPERVHRPRRQPPLEAIP